MHQCSAAGVKETPGLALELAVDRAPCTLLAASTQRAMGLSWPAWHACHMVPAAQCLSAEWRVLVFGSNNSSSSPAARFVIAAVATAWRRVHCTLGCGLCAGRQRCVHYLCLNSRFWCASCCFGIVAFVAAWLQQTAASVPSLSNVSCIQGGRVAVLGCDNQVLSASSTSSHPAAATFMCASRCAQKLLCCICLGAVVHCSGPTYPLRVAPPVVWYCQHPL